MTSRPIARVALALALAAVPSAQAQQPAGPPPGDRRPPMGEVRREMRIERRDGDMMMMEHGPGAAMMKMRGPGPGVASMLLGHTAELKLSDQQVTRLAAIARRTDERHKAMRATMDSLMKAHHAARAADRDMRDGMADMAPMHEKMMQAERADVKDALGVLTLDQQADAWMLRGHVGPMQHMSPAWGTTRVERRVP